MADLMKLLADSIDSETIKKLGAQIGADESATKSAITAALPALLGALGRNASSKEGAEKLHEAVAKDHDGGILDDVTGLLGGSGDGAKILQHVLGSSQPKVNLGIAKLAGLQPEKSNELLEQLAPVVMGAVGKKQREDGLSADGLADELQQENAGIGGAVKAALDGDGDGDLDLSDLLAHGSKFFG